MTPKPIAYPAPPPRLVTWTIKMLQAEVAKGRTPPDDWLSWLTGIQKAMRDGETVQIEILTEADLKKFMALEW